jgi:hypothetical protein
VLDHLTYGIRMALGVKRMKPMSVLAGVLLLTVNCPGSDSPKDWTYKYGLSAPNTRQEGVFGRLWYRGKELPGGFSHVITPAGEFEYNPNAGFSGIQPDGEGIGWEPVAMDTDGKQLAWNPSNLGRIRDFIDGKDPSCRTTTTQQTTSIVSTEPYLEGTLERRPNGAGADWFYIVNKRWWVNPQKMDDTLKAMYSK